MRKNSDVSVISSKGIEENKSQEELATVETRRRMNHQPGLLFSFRFLFGRRESKSNKDSGRNFQDLVKSSNNGGARSAAPPFFLEIGVFSTFP